MIFNFDVKDEAHLAYLREMASKRGIAPTTMVRVVVAAVLGLRLVDEVLDDEGKSYAIEKQPRRHRPPTPAHFRPTIPKSPSTFVAPALPARPAKEPERTRGDLRREQEAAMVRTATEQSTVSDDVQRMSPEQVRRLIESRRGMSFDDTHMGNDK